MDRNTQLAPDFKLSEFIRAEDPLPPEEILENLKLLAQRLQEIRNRLGKPIHISSGYRTVAHNAEVGGEPPNPMLPQQPGNGSYHLYGMAADIEIKDLPPKLAQQFLNGWPGGMGGYETFTHLDIRPYRARWKQR